MPDGGETQIAWRMGKQVYVTTRDGESTGEEVGNAKARVRVDAVAGQEDADHAELRQEQIGRLNEMIEGAKNAPDSAFEPTWAGDGPPPMEGPNRQETIAMYEREKAALEAGRPVYTLGDNIKNVAMAPVRMVEGLFGLGKELVVNNAKQTYGGITYIKGVVTGDDKVRDEGAEMAKSGIAGNLEVGKAIVSSPVTMVVGMAKQASVGDWGTGVGDTALLFAPVPKLGRAGTGIAKVGEEAGPLVKSAEQATAEALAKRAAAEEAAAKAARETEAAKKTLTEEENVKPKKDLEENPAKNCITCTSQPVAFATGAKVLHTPEFHMGWTIALALYRNYSSDLGVDGPLGRNRTGPLDETIERLADGTLLYRMASSLEAIFATPTPIPGYFSRNVKYSHLGLAADARRRLILKDRGLRKTFRKFPDGLWRLEYIKDRNGNTVALERDAAGHLERLVHPDGLSLHFINDASGRRQAIDVVACDGSRKALLSYAYDADGNMVSAANQYGPSHIYTYDAKGRMTGCSDGAKLDSTYVYDENDRVIAVNTRDSTFRYRMNYEAEKNRTTYIPVNRPDATTTVHYNDDRRTTAETDGLGHTRYFEYGPNGEKTAEIDAEGNRTSYRYDDNGNVAAITDAEGRETLYYWSSDGDLQIMFDAESNRWLYEHDDKGNLVSTQNPLGFRTDIVNDAAGQPTGIMRHDGLIEQRDYDEYHRLIGVRSFSGEKTVFERDAFGRVTSIVDPAGGASLFAYTDQRGGDFWEAVTTTRPDGVVTSRSFDADQAVVRATDGEGRTSTYRFGEFDLLQELEDPKGGLLRFKYDHFGKLVNVENQNGLHWTFQRDAAGRVVSETDFDGLTISHVYDTADRFVETRYADGAHLKFSYDKTGALTREEAFAADSTAPQDITRYWYDGRGLVVRAENASALIEFERDKLGAIVAETANGRRAGNVYDCCGNRVERAIGERLVKSIYDPLGAIKSLAIADHAPLAFSRDRLGQETRRESAAGFRLAQSYDLAGQLLLQSAGRAINGGSGIPGTRATGAVDPRHVAPVTERSYQWNKVFAPLAIHDQLFGATVYDYDGNGQVTAARTDELSSSDQDGSRTLTTERFQYDAALNIVGVASGFGSRFGRSTRRPEDGFSTVLSTPGGRIKVSRGPQNEKIFLTHDERGRVVKRRVERDGFRPKAWAYGWDAKDRMISCVTPEGETWVYAYDPFGRRLWKVRTFTEAEKQHYARLFPDVIRTASDADRESYYLEEAKLRGLRVQEARPPIIGVHYFWDGNVLAEQAPFRLDGTVDWDDAIGWHFEPDSFRPLAKENPDGSLLYIVTDHLGTPREMFDEAGKLQWAASYNVWGKVKSLKTPLTSGNAAVSMDEMESGLEGDVAVLACPFRFQGQYEDAETGLYFNHFRYYDPLAGQYISPDPIGLAGGTRRHGYVERPTIFVDPFGLDPHEARISVYDSKGDLRYTEALKSGGTNPGRTLSWPEQIMTHTESASIFNERIQPGDRVIYTEARLPPCFGCRGNMNDAAVNKNISIEYNWVDKNGVAHQWKTDPQKAAKALAKRERRNQKQCC
ncbi:RHS repeat-associated protein [Phyllobacterium myrsinacearum]|uniref:RHS repeat-associated core domain-containing protein n=1 Tax=Phyllobacterium myrsinacearum TaxID=28101 RepID=UPI0010DA0A71|nr:RHS repeat-associated core domain-containing protein [Phyllobacterium myrsinacearum]RZS76780.1 RHS repeat-associated protein [Phyllobacterium myrsinacearum]